jgi:UDP-N-acetylmuramate dehydrogenase
MLDCNSKKWLVSRFGDRVNFNEPMNRHTYFKVGGPAEALVVPHNTEELRELILWCRYREISYLVVGGGSNLLVKDRGIPGVVIVLTSRLGQIICHHCSSHSAVVSAGAGARLQTLCAYAAKRGLGGMNFALGIPGTIGGAITMNAGTAAGSMESVLESATILFPSGEIRTIDKKKIQFSYRGLSWPADELDAKTEQAVVLEGFFRLFPSDPVEIKKESAAILRNRRRTQPTALPSAGCFFRNPGGGKTAGQLIDLAGLKGKKIGDAKVSPRHANFIVNTGKATASDILQLMDLIRKTVLKMFDIYLEPEVRIVGA